MKNECVSIIIPAYNVESYISRGLESCINQTHNNIEIIVVDDGSVDSTWRVVQQYAAIDSRVKALQQENKGVSTARNTALNAVEGEYVLFLDSDDWLEYDAVENLLKWQKNNPQKLVSGGMYFAYSDENNAIRKDPQHKNQNEEELTLEETLLRLDGNLGLVSSCYKLYKKEIIEDKHLRFDTDIFHGEDGLFVFKYLHYTDGLYFNPKPLWVILERPGSATTGGYNIRWLTAPTAVDRMIEFEKNPKIKNELKIYRVNRAMMVMRTAMKKGGSALKDAKKMQRVIRREWAKYLFGNSTVRRKVYYLGMIVLPITILQKIFNFMI